MIGEISDKPVELQYGKFLRGKYIVNSQGGRYRVKSPANAAAFNEKSVLHLAPNSEIGIRIGDVVEISTEYSGVSCAIHLLPDNICLDTAVHKTSSQFGENGP